jgi:hypothetical protein
MAKKRAGKAHALSLTARPAAKVRSKKSPRKPKPVSVRTRLAEPVPDKIALDKLLAKLDPTERDAVNSVLRDLEEHLGSNEAARIWLVIKSPEFGSTPLEAIRSGKATVLKAVVEERWGPNPTYA